MLRKTHEPAINAKLVNPIIVATVEAMETQANLTVALKTFIAHTDYHPNGDISAVIGISGDGGEGMISISFSLPMASMIVSRVQGTKPEHVSADERSDGLGELVKMIADKTKTALSLGEQTSYIVSLPTTILGAKHDIYERPRQVPYLVLEFETDENQTFNVQVGFKSSQTH
jgi:CheY-specific phosphatase CheX